MSHSIVTLLQPTVVILRICGVCPSALRRVYIPSSNRVFGLYLVLHSLVFFILSIERINQTVFGISTLITNLLLVCEFARNSVLILTSFTSIEYLLKFFRIMESAQRSMFSLNIQQPPNPSQIAQLVWLAILFTPRLITSVCMFLEGKYVDLMCMLTTYLIVTGTAAKMRVLLSVVSEKLELLNWHLDDLNNRWPLFLPRPPDVSFKDLSCVREWRKTKFILDSEDNRTVTVEKVRLFNKAHLKLVYAFNTLNSVFSITSLLFIVPGVISLSLCIPVALNVHPFSLFYYSVGFYIMGEIVGICAVLSFSSRVKDQVRREWLFFSCNKKYRFNQLTQIVVTVIIYLKLTYLLKNTWFVEFNLKHYGYKYNFIYH